MNILRDFFFWLDKVVYGFIDAFYQLFLQISNATILSTDTISKFADRIYAIIGIFMLFKITFSLLGLFVDPDKLNDSKVGGGAILKRVVVSMILIVMVPTIFSLGYRLQSEILKQNILGNIILGISTKNVDADTNVEERQIAGKKIMITVFQGFFKPFNSSTFSGNNKTVYDNAINNYNLEALDDVLNVKEGGKYIIDYSVLISTIAGGLAAWIIMIFCFDVAIRSAKLAFLQLIAPIPILSYIDNKKGDQVFNKWVSSVVSTYVDIFVRVSVIFFGVFLISEITAGEGLWNIYDVTQVVNGEYQIMQDQHLLFQAFVILGILLFTKEVPDLIYDILGIKKPSGFTMNPMNRVRQAPLAGKALTSAQARAGGFINGWKNGGLGGALAGQHAAAKAVKGKVGWGGSKDGKGVDAFRAGQSASSKALTGKDVPGKTLWEMATGQAAQATGKFIHNKAGGIIESDDSSAAIKGIAKVLSDLTMSAKEKADTSNKDLKELKDVTVKQTVELENVKQALSIAYKDNEDKFRRNEISVEDYGRVKSEITDQAIAVKGQEAKLQKVVTEIEARMEVNKNIHGANEPENRVKMVIEGSGGELDKINEEIKKISKEASDNLYNRQNSNSDETSDGDDYII